MDGNAPASSDRLVQIHQARDEWEGTLILGYLRDNGIEATLQRPISMQPLDGVELLSRNKKIFGIFVPETEAPRAKPLIDEFVSAVTDETVLVEQAAEHLQLDRETIHRLRRELVEEKKTFEALGWLAIIFFVAATVLWIIWPAWLKTAVPIGTVRWLTILLLVLSALFAGSWANQRMK